MSELPLCETVELDGMGKGGLEAPRELLVPIVPDEKRVVSVSRVTVIERDTVAVVIPVLIDIVCGLDETEPGRDEPCEGRDDESAAELPTVLLAHLEEKYVLVLKALLVSVVCVA